MIQLCELSTPFLHQRWLLSTLGMKSSLLYHFNGLAFTFTFLSVRGVFVTYMLYNIFRTLDNPFVYPTSWLHTVVLNCAFAFQALQFFWCVKVAQGFIAMLTGKQKGSRKRDAAAVSSKPVEAEKKAT
jgi:hypothetical protein